MSRHPAAFAKAQAALRDRGFAPTQQVHVERTIRLSGLGSKSGFGPAADYSESNSDGEILFWSWDDGDDATWEGAIYVEVYSTGEASTWDGQIDASTTEHPWIYYEKTWEKAAPGGGGDPPKVSYPGRPSAPDLQRIVTAVRVGGLRGLHSPVGFFEWASCWRRCVVGGCITAAIGCVFVGPAWPGCFAWACVGVEVGCAIGCAL